MRELLGEMYLADPTYKMEPYRLRQALILIRVSENTINVLANKDLYLNTLNSSDASYHHE